jgi:hypothetical protein
MERNSVRVQLFRYLKTKGFDEEIVLCKFYPSKVDGFTVRRTGVCNGRLLLKKGQFLAP